MDSNNVEFVATNPEMVSNLTDIISSVIYAVATIFAACVAIYGVNSWKREFRGKRRIELAEEVLSLFYQAKDAIEHIRSPMGYSNEGYTRKQDENETPEQTAAWNMAYVAFERYEKWQETFNKLQSLRYRFMVQIGKEEAEPFNEIRKVINRIFSASRRLSQLWVQRGHAFSNERLEKLAESIQKYEAIFWSGEENDEIGDRVNKAVSQMERTCRRIITRKHPEADDTKNSD
jgi:hypothetical protein